MKTFEQLQKEYGDSTCGRSTELYIYQYFEAEMHEYGKELQGTILDLEFDLNRAKELVKDWELECDSLHEQLNALKDGLHNSETENDTLKRVNESLDKSIKIWEISHNEQRQNFIKFLKHVQYYPVQYPPGLRAEIENYITNLLK